MGDKNDFVLEFVRMCVIWRLVLASDSSDANWLTSLAHGAGTSGGK